MEETPRPPMIMPHLVSRASQLAILQLLVEQAKRGEGHLVLISGEAGIGKSRLVAEVKTSTTSQGFLLLQGNCFPTDVTYPYAPLLDLLRSLFASRPAAPLATELERLARDLFPLLPELVPDQAMPLLPLEPEQEKRRLFAVLANFFLRLSASSPLLLIIEDDTMLSAIFEERHTSFDMRRFLHGELLDALYTLTEGNPFFVEETLSAMIAAGDIFYAQGYWNRRSLPAARIPHSVQDAVQQRTQHLGEAAKQVLTLAAVAGRHFDFALLQQLTGYDEEQLLKVMKELVFAQLVVEESTEQFAFRHALTRQVIYTHLLARERTRVHRTIAETMEQLPPAALDAHVEDLANHFYQAKVWQKTVDYAQRAGEKALRLYSH